MAVDNVSMLMLYLRLANIAVSAYLFQVLFSMVRHHHKGSFSKTINIMLVAVVVFFMVEVLQIFRLLGSVESEFIQSVFAFSFLLLLLSVTLHIRRAGLAHEHLVKHRHRQKISDVD